MAIQEWLERLRWSATKRRRVLEGAAREQARECEAARQRLLQHAAAPS
ncbi:hypothetical protein [Actinoplanes sp. NPDC049599]